MHTAEDQQHCADFDGQRLDAFLSGRDLIPQLECQTDEAEIDKIETHHQQVIDRISQRLVAVKNVDQEDAAILVQRVRDPDGQRDANAEINQVSWKRDTLTRLRSSLPTGSTSVACALPLATISNSPYAEENKSNPGLEGQKTSLRQATTS